MHVVCAINIYIYIICGASGERVKNTPGRRYRQPASARRSVDHQRLGLLCAGRISGASPWRSGDNAGGG